VHVATAAGDAVREIRRLGLVHLITIKPILYGRIAARLAGVSAVVAGLWSRGYTGWRLASDVWR